MQVQAAAQGIHAFTNAENAELGGYGRRLLSRHRQQVEADASILNDNAETSPSLLRDDGRLLGYRMFRRVNEQLANRLEDEHRLIFR